MSFGTILMKAVFCVVSSLGDDSSNQLYAVISLNCKPIMFHSISLYSDHDCYA